MQVLRIRLLGEFDVRYGTDRVFTLQSPRLQSLLAYLLLHRDAPQSRERLAFLMWPDSTEAQARTNLRQLLHHLRRGLPDAERYLEVAPRSIQWRPDASIWCDVAAFERAADRAAHSDATAEALAEAVELYGGNLLPSCYDDWLLEERARLRQRHVALLERLIGMLEDQRDYRAGIHYAEQLLRSDPLHETTYRRLMRFHSLLGERARALRVYHTCASVLERELGVEPDAATQAIYESLISAPAAPGDGRQAVAARAPATLVGRGEEWERVRAVWQEAAGGRAQMLAVTGEAGIGKSRLVEELANWCAHQGIATARTRAYAAEGRLAYAPVVEWLRFEVLHRGLSTLDEVWRTELSRLLPELGVRQPNARLPEPLSEGERRRRLFEALARGVLAVDRPLLLVVDDLQWCDQETLEFLHYLVRFEPGARLLVAGTAREEETGSDHPLTAVLAGLADIERLCRLTLGPLPEDEATALASKLCQAPIGTDLARRLYRETEGYPLFLVETVRAWTPAHDFALPPRVRSVIESRLAQLSRPARDLVSLAATVGREFTDDVLVSCEVLDEDRLVQGLDELWQRRIIREHPGGGYDFSHDKIREVAYVAVGPARRRRLHLSVARALTTVHAGDPAGVAGQIATHYDRAGVTDQAIGYYRQAAEAAQRVWASEEVISLLGRALELLRTLPETPQRDADELAVLTELSVALVARRGHGSREANELYQRARDLCDRLGRPLDPPLLRGLGLGAIVRRDFDEAYGIGWDLLRLGESEGERVLAVEGHYLLGVTTFWRGELSSAAEHLRRAIARYQESGRHEHLTLFAQDPKAVCLSRLALAQWHLGQPVTAVRTCEEALAVARRLAHPVSFTYVLLFATWLRAELGDLAMMTELVAEAVAVTTEQEMRSEFNLMVRVFEGWVEASHGDPRAGIARIREGLDGFHDQQRLAMETYGLALLARAYVLGGDEPRADSTVRHALELTERCGQRYLESELLRLQGELLVARDVAAAESAFRQALEVARGQGAKALELRAAAGLARLVRDGTALEEIYARFDEGHDAPDLRSARALLDDLNA